MSVPKDKRAKGELSINTEARGLCTHFLKITGNPKKFSPDQEWFTNKMRDAALGIDLDCWRANNVHADSEALYLQRLSLENRAADTCTDMLEMINIGKSLYRMPTRRYEYLTTGYSNLRKHIRNWFKSDQERLRP